MPAPTLSPPAFFPIRIEAKSLASQYGGRRLFEGLSFSLSPGSLLSVEGPNGCGKSTLLRSIARGLQFNESAIVRKSVPESSSLDAGSSFHYLAHHNGLKDLFTVTENLHYWALCDESDSQQKARFYFALETFRLGPLQDTLAQMLSSGQKRRLALARLLASSRPLWILDEPSVGLDQDSLMRLEETIAQHRGQGGIVIITTHSPIRLDPTQRLSLPDYKPKQGIFKRPEVTERQKNLAKKRWGDDSPWF